MTQHANIEHVIAMYFEGDRSAVRKRYEQLFGEAEPAKPAEPAPEKPKKAKARPVKATAPRPSELERLESDIAAREADIADLERQLADDWSNVDVVAAHRRARDDLQTLLTRWEQLFERSGA